LLDPNYVTSAALAAADKPLLLRSPPSASKSGLPGDGIVSVPASFSTMGHLTHGDPARLRPGPVCTALDGAFMRAFM